MAFARACEKAPASALSSQTKNAAASASQGPSAILGSLLSVRGRLARGHVDPSVISETSSLIRQVLPIPDVPAFAWSKGSVFVSVRHIHQHRLTPLCHAELVDSRHLQGSEPTPEQRNVLASEVSLPQAYLRLRCRIALSTAHSQRNIELVPGSGTSAFADGGCRKCQTLCPGPCSQLS